MVPDLSMVDNQPNFISSRGSQRLILLDLGLVLFWVMQPAMSAFFHNVVVCCGEVDDERDQNTGE